MLSVERPQKIPLHTVLLDNSTLNYSDRRPFIIIIIIDDMMMWYVCGPVSRSTWMEPNVTGTLGTQGTLGEDGG